MTRRRTVYSLLRMLQIAILVSAAAAIPAAADFQAEIVLIEDSFVYIDAGSSAEVREGDFMVVNRPGRAIVHPKTGDTLGMEPVPIAKLRVIYSMPNLAKTVPLVVTRDLPVQIGDPVMRWTGEQIGAVPAPRVVDLQMPRTEHDRPADLVFPKVNPQSEILGSFTIPDFVIDYDFGDMDGDRVSELAVLMENDVQLYRVIGGQLEKLWSSPIDRYKYIALEFFDVDEDGKRELIVTQKRGNDVSADIYKRQGDQMTRAGSVKRLMLRAVDNALYAQRFGFSKPFVNEIHEVRYLPGANSVSQVRKIMKGEISVYGMGIGVDNYAYIDYNDRLAVTDLEGNVLWKGGQTLGGSAVRLESGNKSEDAAVPIKILMQDVTGDGQEDIVVVKNELNPLWGMNIVTGGLRYKIGRFLIYTKGPEGWNVNRETRTFEGYISDIEFTEVGAEGKQISMCLVSSIGRKKYSSRIIVLTELE